MSSLEINVAKGSYEVIIKENSLLELPDSLNKVGLSDQKCAIITDANVANHYITQVKDIFTTRGIEFSYHVIRAGEESKSMEVVTQVSEEMIKEGHDRGSFIIALGGGVVGDIAGFVASIFYRGIPFVQVPTTIVSQVDSSVGGKTGVNTPQGKNLLGSFHQPELVVIDPLLLGTLPQREYLEGYAEVIKHACISDIEILDILEGMDLMEPPSVDLLMRNIKVKARIVEEDERETAGIREVLNFGHTIGHGIEAAVPYGQLLHGEAISIGMRAALYLSVQYNGFPIEDYGRIIRLLDKFSLPTHLPEDIDPEVVIEKMKADKKFSKGNMRFVLLNALGQPDLVEGVEMPQVREAIEDIQQPIEFVEEDEYEVNASGDGHSDGEQEHTFIRFIGGVLSTNGYLIYTGQEHIVIDAPEGFHGILKERGIKVSALLLTHQHFDHVTDAHKFAADGVPIYAYSKYSENLVMTEIAQKWGVGVEVTPYNVDHLIKGTDLIKVNETSICVIPLPGHSNDSVGFYFPGKLILFCGDTLFKGSIGRTDFKGGNSPLLITTIKKRLLSLSGSVQVFPGHGDETTIERERVKNPFLDAEGIRNDARMNMTGGPNEKAMKIEEISS